MKKAVKKSFIYISIIIIFLASIIPIISIGSTPTINGHTTKNILVTINEFKMTLQEAIDNEFFTFGTLPPTHDYTALRQK